MSEKQEHWKNNPAFTSHIIKPGATGNPGGKLKRVRECQALALDETPASFRLLIAQRDDPKEDSRVRQAAAKLLIAYGIGEPPKTVEVTADRGGSALDDLTTDELRALARQSLADDAPETDADDGDDDSDGVEH